MEFVTWLIHKGYIDDMEDALNLEDIYSKSEIKELYEFWQEDYPLNFD